MMKNNGIICKYNSLERITHMSQLVDAEGDDPPGESSSAMHSKDCKLAAL